MAAAVRVMVVAEALAGMVGAMAEWGVVIREVEWRAKEAARLVAWGVEVAEAAAMARAVAASAEALAAEVETARHSQTSPSILHLRPRRHRRARRAEQPSRSSQPRAAQRGTPTPLSERGRL